MADKFENKIKRLELENFTCFDKVGMDFSPGINVFIGENGTGKTHLLKVMYGIITRKEREVSGLPISNTIARKIRNYFKIASGNYLIRSNSDPQKAFVTLSLFKKKYSSSIGWNVIFEQNGAIQCPEDFTNAPFESKALFIPVLEILSWYKGFISAYENRESNIDETYYLLAKALDPLPLKGRTLEEQLPLMKELEQAINAKVVRKGDEFLIGFLNDQTEYKSLLVAQGINKIAQLIYLIMNGSLTKDTILFWDEPEANLNPKYIVIVAKFLQTLANAGCQIFVATHDYILPYELSLSAEYRDVSETPVPDMKFFSLYKGENGTEVEEGATMSDLSHDAIHEGLTLHQNKEDRLFQKSLNVNP